MTRSTSSGQARGPYHRWPPWTADEDRQLRALWRHDRYDTEIGNAIGRSRAQVQARRRVLGLAPIKYRGHPPETLARIGAASLQRWQVRRRGAQA